MPRVIHVYVPDALHKRVWKNVDKPDESLTALVIEALERECDRREKAQRRSEKS